MSTPISKFLLVAAVLALAACDGGFNATRNAPARIALPDGTVVAGANGWCVDKATSRASDDTAVIVLGSCAAIARNAFAPRPDVPGIFTVSVESEQGIVPTPEELAGFFATDAGRAVLARDGRAASVKILETRSEDGLLFLRATDTSAAPGTNPETWRALFGLGGHFISVSLYGLIDQPIAPEDGLETLSAQVDELRKANS